MRNGMYRKRNAVLYTNCRPYKSGFLIGQMSGIQPITDIPISGFSSVDSPPPGDRLCWNL